MRSPLLLLPASLLAGAAVLFAPVPVAVVGGTALAFVLPGLALAGLLFRSGISTVERVVLTPALSIATLIFGALALNAASIPLHRPAWTTLTVGLTMIAALSWQLRLLLHPGVGTSPAAADPGTAASAPTLPPPGALTLRPAAFRPAAFRPAAFRPAAVGEVGDWPPEWGALAPGPADRSDIWSREVVRADHEESGPGTASSPVGRGETWSPEGEAADASTGRRDAGSTEEVAPVREPAVSGPILRAPEGGWSAVTEPPADSASPAAGNEDRPGVWGAGAADFRPDEGPRARAWPLGPEAGTTPGGWGQGHLAAPDPPDTEDWRSSSASPGVARPPTSGWPAEPPASESLGVAERQTSGWAAGPSASEWSEVAERQTSGWAAEPPASEWSGVAERQTSASPGPAGPPASAWPEAAGRPRLVVHEAAAGPRHRTGTPSRLVVHDVVTVPRDESARRRGGPIRSAVPLILLVLVLLAAGWLSVTSARDTEAARVATLSIGFAATPAADGAGRRVVVRVAGLEPGQGPYTVTVTGPGDFSETVTVPEGAGTAPNAAGRAPMANAAGWAHEVDVPGADGRITAELFRGLDAETAYRSVFLDPL